MRTEWASRNQAAATEATAGTTAEPATPADVATLDSSSAEPTVDALGRKHDPATGHFLPAGEQPAGTEATAPAVETGTEPKAGEQPAEAVVRVRIAADHPLRANGRYTGPEEIPVPPALEEVFRYALNDPIRRADVEATRREAEQTVQRVQDQLAEASARLEVAQSRVRSLIADPSLAAIYADLKQAYGDDHADRWLDGELRQDEAQIMERLEAHRQQQMQQVAVQAEAGFRSEAIEAVRSQVPWWAEGSPNATALFDRAWREYSDDIGAALQAGRSVAPSVEEFIGQYLRPRFATDPYTLSYLQQQNQQAEAARREQEAERQREAAAEAERKAKAEREAAVQEFKQQAAQTRQTMPPNPLGQVHGSVRSDKVSVGTPAQDLSQVSTHDLRRTLKQQSRQDARSLFNR